MKLLISIIIILTSSTINGFVIPSVNHLDVENLVVRIPGMPSLPLVETTAKTVLIPLILLSPFFVKQGSTKSENPSLPFSSDDEIDFDAPLERQMEVDHIVRRQPYTIGLGNMGTMVLPSFLHQGMFLDLYEPEHKFQLSEDFNEQYYTLIHDECYLGKDCTAHECVDFDPLHETNSRTKRVGYHF